MLTLLAEMGQVLFDPPSVGGWPQNEYWLSTAAALARLAASPTGWRHAPTSRRWLTSTGPRGPTPPPSCCRWTGWSTTTAAALPGRRQPPALMTLALVSPEYVSN